MAETNIEMNEDQRSGIYKLTPMKANGQPGQIEANSGVWDEVSSSGPAALVIEEQTADFVRMRVRAMGTSGQSVSVFAADSDTGAGVVRITHTFITNALPSLAQGFGVEQEGPAEVDPDL